MIPAVELATALLIVGGYFALAFIAAVLIGKALSLNTRLETLAERRETDGPLSALREENGAKVARANFRHATRHSKDVA